MTDLPTSDRMQSLSEINYSFVEGDQRIDYDIDNGGAYVINMTSDYMDSNNQNLYILDYSQMNYLGEIKQLPTWEIAIKVSLYAIIILLAMAGNLLIIIVVAKNKRMQTTTNYFIVNLAVADLLVTCCCTWVRIVDDVTEGWVLGDFFCKLNSVAQVTSLVASIFSLVLIACDRFFGIVFSMKAHIIERSARYSIILVWVCSLAVAGPLFAVRRLQTIPWANHDEVWCDDNWPMHKTHDEESGMVINSFPSRKAYYLILTIALFFVPVVLMTVMYSLIVTTVWFSRSPCEQVTMKEVKIQRRVKRKVLKMLILILTAFCICWIPLQVTILFSEFRTNKSERLPDWYVILEFIAYTLAFANSALNPLIYAGFNENFRKGFRALFGCYDRKPYAAISRADSMLNTSTSNSATNAVTHVTKL